MQLAYPGAAETVTWESDEPSIVSVNSSGLITALRPGSAYILASSPGGLTKICTVHVTIPDGVYRIQNKNSNLPLGVFKGGVLDGATARLQSMYTTFPTILQQLWKIKYLGNGNYSIRPLHRLSQVLYDNQTTGFATMRVINETGDESGLSYSDQWQITQLDNGYQLRNRASDEILYPNNGSTSVDTHTVTMPSYSGSDLNYYWNLVPYTSPVRSVLLYDCNTSEWLTSSYSTTVPIVYAGLTGTKSLAELGLVASVCDVKSVSQQINWSSSNKSVATVNITTGAITPISVGETTITGICDIDDVPYQVQYTLKVLETYWIVNYYDGTVANNTNALNSIDEAVDFLNVVYNSFGVFFAMDGTPQFMENAPVDSCPHEGEYACDGNCRELYGGRHHKNIWKISEDLLDNAEENHIYVLWSDTKSEVYCYGADDIGCVARPAGDCAVVVGNSDAILFYQLIGNDEINILAYMAVVLAHEVSHTFGMFDVYCESHDGPDGFQCIMEHYDADSALAFYQDILNSIVNPFCTSCINTIQAKIPDSGNETQNLVILEENL